MKQKLILALVTLATITLSATKLHAKEFKYTKEYKIEQRYKTTSDIIADIDCSYTDLEIIPNTNSNEIYLSAKVTISSRKEWDIENPWELINIYHSLDGNIFKFKTQRMPNKSKSSAISIDIDCRLYLPEEYLPQIIAKYSTVRVSTPTSKPLRLLCKHSDIELLTEFTSANIESQYSDIQANGIGKLTTTMSYGEFNINKNESIKGIFGYSVLDIKETTQTIDVEAKYSELKISSKPTLSEFKCTAKYSDIDLICRGFKPNIKGEIEYAYLNTKGCELQYTTQSLKPQSGFKGASQVQSIDYDPNKQTIQFKLNASYTTFVIRYN